MTNSLQGWGLALLNQIAGAQWPDRLGLRQPMEKLVYWSSRESFRWATTTLRPFADQPGQRHRLTTSANKPQLFDLSLSDEQQQMVDTISRFAQDKIYPLAHQADTQCSIPDELLQASKELGLRYYAVSETWGGMATEASTMTQALIAEALAHGDYSIAAVLLSPVSVANALNRWGSGPQQARYLPALIDETSPLDATIAVMEPGSLFNPLQLKTTAQRLGDSYILQGDKTLVLNGNKAQLYLIAAQTPEGPAVFLVEGGQAGLTWRSTPAMGLKAAETSDLHLEAVRLPLSARLGDNDFNYQEFLDYGSLGWCALATGCAQAALDYVIPYCNEREAFGEPISHRQGVAFTIAQMAIEIESMRILTWRAAARAEAGNEFHREAYLARIFCAEKSMFIGTNAVQLLGGHGFTKEHPVERWYRDLRSTAILWGGLHL